MKITTKQYAEALYQVLIETSPEGIDLVVENFAQILHENGHLALWPEIEEEFLTLEAKARGGLPAQVTVAKAGTEDELASELHSLLGRNLILRKKIDEGLIGGVVVETETERLDASVRKSLKDLKKSLIN